MRVLRWLWEEAKSPEGAIVFGLGAVTVVLAVIFLVILR